MAAKEKKTKSRSKNAAPRKEVENSSGELSELRWSVISFEKCIAKNLSYTQAEKKLIKFEAEKIAGLCIVFDEAAEKIGGKR